MQQVIALAFFVVRRRVGALVRRYLERSASWRSNIA